MINNDEGTVISDDERDHKTVDVIDPSVAPRKRFSIGYLWALRVPVITGIFIVVMPWISFWPKVRPLLSGLFDPVKDLAVTLITALALFNAWTIVIIVMLIVTYGSSRLDLPRLSYRIFPVRPYVWVVSALLAAPVVSRTVSYSIDASAGGRTPTILWYVGLGIVVAVGLLGVALLISEWLDREDSALRKQVAGSWIASMYGSFLSWLSRFPFFSAGFLIIDPQGVRCPRLARGHGLALGLACSSVFLYVCTGVLTRNMEYPVMASALGYLLLLVLMLMWLAGFAAFLFDRCRVPLTALVAVWILMVNTLIDPLFPTDHIYQTVPLSTDALPLGEPSELLGSAMPPIVVAAAGGGIQAAAWTARVLTGLDVVPGFTSSTRLISAVSGGSVGAMNFIAGKTTCGPPLTEAESGRDFDPNVASQDSSLHAVGWGLVFKDLPRTIVPMFSSPLKDRGSLLEDAWKREPRLRKSDSSPLLASWRLNVPDGLCPGVVYNAMAAETGEPMLFATVELPKTLKAFDFYARYPGRDLPMATAVRLSSSFPYVSPASRADADDETKRYVHVVDGGYFDNYGVGTLAAIVHAALQALPTPTLVPRHLLVIEICDALACSGDEPASAPSPGGADRAWPYQIVAPLSGIIATRSAAQRVTDRTSLRLLKDYWATQHTCVESIQVSFGSDETPLSWHLTAKEKAEIDKRWTNIAVETSERVRQFLGGHAATDEGGVCLATPTAN